MRIERLVLAGLLHDEDYTRKVVPHLKAEYFAERSERVVFEVASDHIVRYNGLPTRESVRVGLDARKDLSDEAFQEACEVVASLEVTAQPREWLLDATEAWCKKRAVHNAVLTAISILNEEGKRADGLTPEAIPGILQDSLNVAFDTRVGHDFLEDAADRYAFYHERQKRVPFDIEYLNRITKGGLPAKTLTAILAGTNVGKSLAMCHMAAANLTAGYNVLYVTLEMAEERISERIDANLLDVTMEELATLPRDTYLKRVDRLKSRTQGRLFVKEYPTASAHVGNFRHLLNELRVKKSFVPDIIYVDYLNICASSRIRMGQQVNSYTYVKAIAEELRGLAVEFCVPIVTATQTNRQGSTNSDVDMTETSESFGLPMTVDLMFALISNEELQQLNQYMVKQLKNRFADVTRLRRFVVGVDRARMRLYDVEETAQTLVDDVPVMDGTSFGQRVDAEARRDLARRSDKFDRKRAFEGFT